jgi:signal transduction histidine kinase
MAPIRPDRPEPPRGMSRDEFASLVAHELRNPLNAASGWLHLLASEPGARTDLAQRALAGLRRALEQQLAQIDLLAGVLRLAGGDRVTGAAAVGLDTVLVQVADGLADTARAAGRAVRVDVAADVPARVVGDRAMLVAALTTLGGFAIRHGSPGAPLCLALDAEAGAPRVALSIDEGDDGGLSIWHAFGREGARLPLDLLHAVLAIEAQGARLGLRGSGRVPEVLFLRFGPRAEAPAPSTAPEAGGRA